VKVLGYLFGILVLLVVAGAGAGLLVVRHHAAELPDYQALAAYDPPVTSRVYAGDGRLLAEYAVENRLFVPIEAIPKRVIQAFLAAEDKSFYSHHGIDLLSIARAAMQNLMNLGSDRRPVGASTITQQVAKNFLLTNEVSLERKLKEAILAYRIEQAFTKDRILELYLNEIYLGFNSYGVAAAALNYFNKSLDDLTLAEAAYLAALPKAPNNYHPTRRAEAAKWRRDWVLDRMAEDTIITGAEAETAKATPLTIRRRTAQEMTRADAFAEEVRRDLARHYGDDAVYKGGLTVRATLDPALQEIAEEAFRDGLVEYDRRHGWRGPIARIDAADMAGDKWPTALAAVAEPPALKPWVLAVVLETGAREARIGLAGGKTGRIPFDEVKWARETRPDQKLGPAVRAVSEVLAVGDVVAVEAIEATEQRPPPRQRGRKRAAPRAQPREAPAKGDLHALRQVPDVSGGLIALDPHTGRVLAMVGGLSYDASQFNRATQARRQPGSAFKPFVYLAALEAGMPPNTIILDAPFVFDPGAGQPRWKPANFSHKFYGPTPMRVGLELSRNLMTVRLAETVGMGKVVDIAERFGVADSMEPVLAMALGSGETTLMRMTAAYAMIVNGGKRIKPTLIDRVQDKHGRTVFRHDTRVCETCRPDQWKGQDEPTLADPREQVIDPRTAYQMVSLLEGVVQRGTAGKVAALRRPLAGKTGTTNDAYDGWFIGFSPDLVVGTYVGFDKPRTLGSSETGGSVAVPIFMKFMEAALEGRPVVPFRMPPGLRLVRIDRDTGAPARQGEGRTIMEVFKPGTEPTGDTAPTLDGVAGYDAGYDSGTGAASADPSAPGAPPYGGQGGDTPAAFPAAPARPAIGATPSGIY